jgi:hypothetical protein
VKLLLLLLERVFEIPSGRVQLRRSAHHTTAMSDTGCDMTEEELLALLKGIDATKIQQQTKEELDAKYGPRGGSGGDSGEGKNGIGNSGEGPRADQWTGKAGSAEEFLAAAGEEDHDGEKADLNQYWYSVHSINKLLAEVRNENPKPLRVAFVSTPSLFFSLSVEERAESAVLDYDRQWEGERGFHFYDFNEPESIPADIQGTFDMVVIDPPFVQEECWRKYAVSAKLLLKEGGQVLLTTILENAELLEGLLGVHPNKFRPSVPNLVYQYHVYTNYDSKGLAEINPEIGF